MPVPVGTPSRRELVAASLEEGQATGREVDEKVGQRMLAATTPVKACYAACYNYYAPNAAQFLFQLVEVNYQQVCQCCKTCNPILTQAGALLMEACVPNTVLSTATKLSRHYAKASDTKPLPVTYSLRLKGTAKSLQLAYMGVQLSLPPGATVIRTMPRPDSKAAASAPVAVHGNTVTWYPLSVDGMKARVLKAELLLRPPFNATSGIRFQTTVFQNAYDLAAAPYCVHPARDVAVAVKYP